MPRPSSGPNLNKDVVRGKSAKAVYLRIQSTLRTRIAAGDWAIGEAIPNRANLCEEFATTRVTLDKAVQGLVSEGLLRSTRGVGTFVADPNTPERSRTLRVGLVVARGTLPKSDAIAISDNFYFGPLFQGIRETFSGKPVDTVFAHLHHSEYVQFCRESGVDGSILIALGTDDLVAMHQLHQEGLYFVAAGISSTNRRDIDIAFEDTDNRQGARDAVRHLVELGHRKIAIVNLATSVANHHDRTEGYVQALTDAGLTVRPNDFVLMSSYDGTRFEDRVEEWLTRALATGTLPTAVFVCDYLMSLATLRVLRRHGLRVPEDISVVGFDDPESAEHLNPPLTTVRQPVRQLGVRAAERLLAGVRDRIAPRGTEMLPTELIVRESTCEVATTTT